MKHGVQASAAHTHNHTVNDFVGVGGANRSERGGAERAVLSLSLQKRPRRRLATGTARAHTWWATIHTLYVYYTDNAVALERVGKRRWWRRSIARACEVGRDSDESARFRAKCHQSSLCHHVCV